jgi:hypothetical protein
MMRQVITLLSEFFFRYVSRSIIIIYYKVKNAKIDIETLECNVHAR